MSDLVEEGDVESLMGCRFVSWSRGDEGLNISLDDGRVLLFIGGILAIYKPAECVH